MDSVLVCMPSRSGSPEFGPFKLMADACQYVAESGRANAAAISKENKYGVAPCRNMAVAEMMADRQVTHLLMVDDDVYVPRDAIAKLLDVRKDIVGGCYPSIEHADGKLAVETYIVAWEGSKKLRHWFRGPRKVSAVGTGCILIKRSVFERMPFPWFRWGEYLIEGKYQQQSDDLDFCTRCGKAGIEVWLHGDVRCGHVKPVDIANFVTEEPAAVALAG